MVLVTLHGCSSIKENVSTNGPIAYSGLIISSIKENVSTNGPIAYSGLNYFFFIVDYLTCVQFSSTNLQK